jgi:acetyl-CoA carboxylase biotin carboxyl carrier protein
VTSADDPLLESAGVSASQLAAILDLVAGSDIAELDVAVGGTRLSLRRPPVLGVSPGQHQAGASAAETGPLAIGSPLVGIFRSSVAPGETVLPGQSIGAIEALGMPTNVEAPQSGTVEDVLVEDGSPVEYGQPLLTLRRAPYAL